MKTFDTILNWFMGLCVFVGGILLMVHPDTQARDGALVVLCFGVAILLWRSEP